MLELLNEIVIQQPMFQLINGAASLDRQGFKPHPDQKGTGNMITLNPRFATFAAFQTGHLFTFAVQLLNLPTEATRLLRGCCRVLSTVVGDDVIRAVCGHHNPETLHFVVLRKPFDFDAFAVLMDTWYATKDLRLFLESLQKIYYCPQRDNRSVDDAGAT